MTKLKTWELMNARIEKYASGPRQGQFRPFKLPEDAVPVGVWSAHEQTFVDYLVPKR